jgi:hypothetical protein
VRARSLEAAGTRQGSRDEHREVNKKKIHRLWREEGLQVKVNSRRKRSEVSSIPPVDTDAPNVVRATDFQFDSTIDDEAIKIASMLDEHTRESLLHVAERSITAERQSHSQRRTVGGRARRYVRRRRGWAARRCCGWTTARNWFPKHCNGSAKTRSGLERGVGHFAGRMRRS